MYGLKATLTNGNKNVSDSQNASQKLTVSPGTGKRMDYLKWDDYFMAMALLSAKRSKDPSTQVGSCIVDNENRIVSIGYNGFPRKCDDDEFPWTKSEEDGLYNHKMMYVVHAEANAILNKNAANISGMKLYTTLFPCNECAKLIIQSGVQKVYYLSDKYVDKPSFKASRRMFNAVGVICIRHVPSTTEIVIDFQEFLQEDKGIDLNLSSLQL